MLFQLDIFDVINILRVTPVILLVASSIGLIIVGVSQIRNEDKFNTSLILIIDGIIIILYFVINERLSMVLLGVSGYTILYLMIQYTLYYLIPNIIVLITLGISFLILGIKNKQNFGKFLIYSGIFWIIFCSIAIVANSIYLLSYLPGPFGIPLLLTVLILPIIASIFAIIAGVFFIIYASKLDMKILLVSSILLLLYSIAFSSYSIVILINYLI